MPVDYGRLTARQRAEQKRIERARKRAGQPKPKPTPRPLRPADTGRDKAEIAARAVTPGVGDTAREKSRVAVQGRARDAYEAAVVQPLAHTPKSRAQYRKAQLGLRTSLTDLTPGERKDFSGYTKVRSEQSMAEHEQELKELYTKGLPAAARIAAAGPSLYLTGNVDPLAGVKSVRDFAQRQKAILMDRNASLKEKLGAAGQTTMMAGVPGGGPRRPNLGEGGVPGRTRKDIEAEIEAVKNDPKSYNYERGGRFLKPEAADRFDALNAELRGAAAPRAKAAPEPPEPAAPQSGEGFDAWRARLWGRLTSEGTPVPPTGKLYRAVSEAEFEAAQKAGAFRSPARDFVYVTNDPDRIAGGAYGGKGGGYIIEVEPLPTRTVGTQTLAKVDELAVDEIPLAAVSRVYRWNAKAGDHMEMPLPWAKPPPSAPATTTPGHVRFYRDPRETTSGAGGYVLPEQAPPAPTPAQQIVSSLPSARRTYAEQEALRSAERSRRSREIAEAQQEIGGREGYEAAREKLRGELPKLRWGEGLRDFDQETVENLLTQISEHTGLRPYEKHRTQAALLGVIEHGRTPTPSQIKLFARAFGPELAEDIAKSRDFWRMVGQGVSSIINVPRAIKSSFDISAPLRQALVLGARHPVIWSKQWGPMLKSLGSQKAYDDLLDEIVNRPNFELMDKAGLHITDLGGLSSREEGFMTNMADVIPGIKQSGRAYTGFLNKFRADAFDNYVKMLEKNGEEITPEQLKSVANWVNTATGRGSIKKLEGAIPPLNAVFFSPRLMMSRLQLLNPVYYARLDPFARKQALRGAAQLLGGMSLTLYMAKMAGAEVSMDPRNADFGKIKVGDTRIDIAGGLQQYIVNGYRVLKRESVSSTTGEVQQLEGGFAKPSRWDIAERFVTGKFAPPGGYIKGWAKNENFAGEPFERGKEAGKLFLPLGGENAFDAYKESGLGTAALSFGLGGIGTGVLTYSGKKPKAVEGHEARMAALRKDRRAHGRTDPDPEAIAASRLIREVELGIKKGGDKTPREKALITFRHYKKAYPKRVSYWEREFSRTTNKDDWQSAYETMKREIAEPYTSYGLNMDGSVSKRR